MLTESNKKKEPPMATNKELAEDLKKVRAENEALKTNNEILGAENTRLAEELQSTLEHHDEVNKAYDEEIARLRQELQENTVIEGEPDVGFNDQDYGVSKPLTDIVKVAEFTHNVGGRGAVVRVKPVVKGKSYEVFLKEIEK